MFVTAQLQFITAQFLLPNWSVIVLYFSHWIEIINEELSYDMDECNEK